MNISGNTILITGGGTGIGRALAEALHARGNQIVITGRRADVLKDAAAANPGMAWAALDVADPAAVAAGLAFIPLTATPTYNATKAALHSWTQSLRHQLRDTAVEVLELAPPGVATDLMPGHAQNPASMPLADYTAEVMDLIERGETPRGEILVERVKPLRFAEADGYQAVFEALNGAG